MSTKKLPDKPSALLLRALKDVEKVERSPNMEIQMDLYLANEDGKCKVCAAGAVMYWSLGQRISATPSCFDADTMKKLWAIDEFRVGYTREALNRMKLQNEKVSQLFSTMDRDELENLSMFNREQWKLHMLDLIGVLKAEGL